MNKTFWLATLINLVTIFTPNVALSAEEICGYASVSGQANYVYQYKYYSQFLLPFEEMLKEKSARNIDLNQVDCNRKGLFAATYTYASRIGYATDVRFARHDNLSLLIEYGYDLTVPNSMGVFPIHYVARIGDINLMYLLAEKGADLNAQTIDGSGQPQREKKGMTPLYLAIRGNSGNIEAINLLLHLGADPNFVDRDNQTPLSYAIDSFAMEAIEVLLQHGAQPSPEVLERVESQLSSKGYGKAYGEIKTLLEKYRDLRTKAILQGQDPQKLTFNPPPPHHLQHLPTTEPDSILRAISRNEIDLVKQLISEGIEINAFYNQGETALHKAVGRGNYEIAALLIEAGADVNLQDDLGMHPLYKASSNPQLIRLLLDNGALVNRETVRGGKTALHVTKNVESAKLLLEYGADINREYKIGGTPLLRAVRADNKPLVEFLLEQGANPHLADRKHKTPLMHAVILNKIEIAKILLPYVNPEQKRKVYELAVSQNNLEMQAIFENSDLEK